MLLMYTILEYWKILLVDIVQKSSHFDTEKLDLVQKSL